MGLVENTILSLIRHKLSKALSLDDPEVQEGIELPVIVNIHGGGLIDGNKNLSVGFCR